MYILYLFNILNMEISITEFRNNISTYFDKVYFGKEDIILRKRWYKLKLTCEIDDIDENDFDKAVKSPNIKEKLSLLSSKIH